MPAYRNTPEDWLSLRICIQWLAGKAQACPLLKNACKTKSGETSVVQLESRDSRTSLILQVHNVNGPEPLPRAPFPKTRDSSSHMHHVQRCPTCFPTETHPLSNVLLGVLPQGLELYMEKASQSNTLSGNKANSCKSTHIWINKCFTKLLSTAHSSLDRSRHLILEPNRHLDRLAAPRNLRGRFRDQLTDCRTLPSRRSPALLLRGRRGLA